MLIKQYGFLLVVLLAFATSPVKSFGQDSAIKDKRVTLKMENVPLNTIFSRLINDYGILLGFEESEFDRKGYDLHFEWNVWARNPSPEDAMGLSGENVVNRKFSIDLENARFEDAMDSIVNEMKHYDWEINDGVVNIFPIRGRDRRLEKLLDLKIEDFWLGKGEKVNEITPQITLFLLEYKKFLTDNNLFEGTYGPHSRYHFRTVPEGVRFKNIKFKDLLNALTKAKGGGGWILQIKKLHPTSRPDAEFLVLFI